VSTFNLLNAIEIQDGFDPDAASRRNLKESTPVLSPKKASIWSRRFSARFFKKTAAPDQSEK
jgi:hypothetical protein